MTTRIYVTGHRDMVGGAKVGGIHANNTYPADFIYESLMIECNVIHQAFVAAPLFQPDLRAPAHRIRQGRAG